MENVTHETASRTAEACECTDAPASDLIDQAHTEINEVHRLCRDLCDMLAERGIGAATELRNLLDHRVADVNNTLFRITVQAGPRLPPDYDERAELIRDRASGLWRAVTRLSGLVHTAHLKEVNGIRSLAAAQFADIFEHVDALGEFAEADDSHHAIGDAE